MYGSPGQQPQQTRVYGSPSPSAPQQPQRSRPRQYFDRPAQPPQPPQPQPYEAPREPAPRRVRVPRPSRRAGGSGGGLTAIRKVTRLGCLPSVLIALLAFVLIFTFWADARLTRVDAMPDKHVAQTAGTNWLLVGSDSRQGLSDKDIERLGTGEVSGQGRTDTIMLLHIPRSGKAQLISIPRDSYVDIPGNGKDKINAAFAYGGPKLLTQTVEQTTGLHVDHYAEIGMGGLAALVDVVDGVDICVKEPMQDPKANLDIQAGCQTMDGPTALGYVRTRDSANGDLDRVQRQREFFTALMKKATSWQTLLNPFDLIPLTSKATATFTVGKGEHVWHMARLALAMGRGVETNTVPVGGFEDTDVGSVVLWDDQAAQQMFDSMK